MQGTPLEAMARALSSAQILHGNLLPTYTNQAWWSRRLPGTDVRAAEFQAGELVSIVAAQSRRLGVEWIGDQLPPTFAQGFHAQRLELPNVDYDSQRLHVSVLMSALYSTIASLSGRIMALNQEATLSVQSTFRSSLILFYRELDRVAVQMGMNIQRGLEYCLNIGVPYGEPLPQLEAPVVRG